MLGRSLLAAALAVHTLGGCAPLRKTKRTAQSQTTSLLTEDVAERSQALHGLLVGSLYANAGDVSQATKYFEQSSTVLGAEGSPLLAERLAELYLVAGDLKSALNYVEAALMALPVGDQVAKGAQRSEAETAFRELTLLKAGLLSARGDKSTALAEYIKTQELFPSDFDTLYLVFDGLVRAGRLSDAQTLIEQYVKEHKKDFRGFFLAGILAELQGDVTRAESRLSSARQLSADQLSVELAYARVLLRAGDHVKAKAVYRELLEVNPEDLSLKRIYLALDQATIDDELLGGMLDKAQIWASDECVNRYLLAQMLLESGSLRRAINELYLVLLINPDFSQARYLLATIYASLGSQADAITELKQIEVESPLFVKSRVFATVLHRQLKNVDEAEAMIRAALSVEKDNLHIVLYLIDILKEAKRFDEAESVIQKALESHPESGHLIYDYAMLLHVMKKEREAEVLMRKVVDLHPDHDPALNYLAYSMAEQGKNLEVAQEMAQRALSRQPENGYYLDTLGWIQFKQKDYEAAVITLERAAALAPNDGVVVEHFGDSLVKLHNLKLAKEVYGQALAAFEGARDDGTLADLDALRRVRGKLSRLK